ncbi:MAG: aminotransferase class V-fold PLP-dependent enzyme [Deltaproteobacteria bacterium]|nr:aminotransferase class V-fold PLP-dependent enzyme [Deltaproteobacteria bacterium]
MFNESLIQSEFPKITSLYFNSAYMGPLSLRARTRIQKTIERFSDPSFLAYEEWLNLQDQAREKLSHLLGCSIDRIAHQSSVSDLVSLAAGGFPFCGGDTVVTLSDEYPSNVLPWMIHEKRRPFKLQKLDRALAYDPALFVRSLPPKTRVVNLSHVSFQTGDRLDILEIGRRLREREIFFIVDASQSFGGMTVTREELEVIDLLAVVTYKWLLGPYGHAFGCFSDRAINLVERSSASWLTMPQAPYGLTEYTLDTKPGARKFDRGQSPNILLLQGLIGSLELIEEVGLSSIEAHNQSLTNHFIENLPKNKYPLITSSPLKGNIACLKVDSAEELKKGLRQKSIDASVREGNLRLSFHLFNNLKQVDQLLEVL